MKTKIYFFAVILFFVCLLGAMGVVHAEMYGIVGVGQGQAQLAKGTSDGGIAWQQKGFPHHEGLTNTVYSAGFGYNFNRTFAAEARYQTGMDVTVHGQWGFEDNGAPVKDGPYSADGGAHVKGLSLAGIGRYHITSDLALGIEGGVFFWDSAFRVRINSRCNSYVYEPVKTRGIGSLIGGVVSYRNLDLRYEVFHVEPRDGNFNAVKEISLNYRF